MKPGSSDNTSAEGPVGFKAGKLKRALPTHLACVVAVLEYAVQDATDAKGRLDHTWHKVAARQLLLHTLDLNHCCCDVIGLPVCCHAAGLACCEAAAAPGVGEV